MAKQTQTIKQPKVKSDLVKVRMLTFQSVDGKIFEIFRTYEVSAMTARIWNTKGYAEKV